MTATASRSRAPGGSHDPYISSSSASPGSRASRSPTSRARSSSPPGLASHTTVPCVRTASSRADASASTTDTDAPTERSAAVDPFSSAAYTGCARTRSHACAESSPGGSRGDVTSRTTRSTYRLLDVADGAARARLAEDHDHEPHAGLEVAHEVLERAVARVHGQPSSLRHLRHV